jgi:hypothetical protein
MTTMKKISTVLGLMVFTVSYSQTSGTVISFDNVTKTGTLIDEVSNQMVEFKSSTNFEVWNQPVEGISTSEVWNQPVEGFNDEVWNQPLRGLAIASENIHAGLVIKYKIVETPINIGKNQ